MTPLHGPDSQSNRLGAGRAAGVQHSDGRTAAADVDQCAPPGVDSASAVPTNLASAAKGPGEDKYTTATVAPLDTVNVGALGLGTPGVLTVGTLSDAPPSICINSQGAVHRVRQRAAAGDRRKAGLANQFRRHRVLRPARPGGVTTLRRRLVVDHHHRCPAAHRRVHQRLRLRLLLAGGADRVGDHRVRQARRGPAHRRRAGHRAGGLRRRHPAPGSRQVPRLQHRLRQPEDQADRRLGGAVAAGAGHRAARRSGRDHRKHLQLGQFRRLRGRQGEQAADRRAELRPGRGHRRRHLVAAVLRLGAARAAAGLETGVQGGAASATAGLRGHRRQPPASGVSGFDLRRSRNRRCRNWPTRSSTGSCTSRRSPTCSRRACRTR